MDPSYDNGFGSVNPSGAGGGRPVGGGAPMNTGVPVGAGVSMNTGVPTMSTGTGDVIIGGAPEKKSRKGLIIGIIVAVVVLIVVGVAAVIATSGRGNETARQKFNRLINYVVSGEASAKDYTGAFSNDAEYYFDTQQANLENRETLYATTSALLDDFMNSYNKLEDKSKFSANQTEFEKIMKNEGEILEFARVVRVKQIPNIYAIISVYFEKGKAGAISDYARYYDFSTISGNSYVKEFEEVFKKYIDLQVEITEIYSGNNCLSGNTIKVGCIENVSDDSLKTLFNNLVGDVRQVKTDLDYYYGSSKYLVAQLFDANRLVYYNVSVEDWSGADA